MRRSHQAKQRCQLESVQSRLMFIERGFKHYLVSCQGSFGIAGVVVFLDGRVNFCATGAQVRPPEAPPSTMTTTA